MKSAASLAANNTKLVASFSALDQLYRGFDGAAAALSSALGVSICVSCGKCCQQTVPPAFWAEGENMISNLLGQPWRQALVLDQAEEWLQERVVGVTEYGPAPASIQGDAKERIYRDLQILARTRCPLLHENRCLVNDGKPIPCRAYGVTILASGCTRPAGLGETEFRRSYYGGPGAVTLRQQLNRFVSSLDPHMRLSGFMPTMLHMRLRSQRFAGLVDSGKVPTAKAIFLHQYLGNLWQEPLDTTILEGIPALVGR